MVALLNVSVFGFALFAVVLVQAKTPLEPSNDTLESKSPMNSQRLYEIYKIMRADPRLVTVPNQDLVLYIYRNYVLGSGNNNNAVQPKRQKNRRHRIHVPIQVE